MKKSKSNCCQDNIIKAIKKSENYYTCPICSKDITNLYFFYLEQNEQIK